MVVFVLMVNGDLMRLAKYLAINAAWVGLFWLSM